MSTTRITLSSLAMALAFTGCKLPNDTSNDEPVPPIATEACEPWDCGSLPDGDQVMCPDGVTLSGPTGECIEHGSECAWKVVSCPVTTECEPGDCGPASAQPNYLCADNLNIAGPTGRCLERPGGCAWEIVTCPAGTEICPDSHCGPAPQLPNWVCPDGETVAGPNGVCQKESDGSCAWQIVRCSGLN